MQCKVDNRILDLSHTKIDREGYRLLLEVAESLQLVQKTRAMFSGDVINQTEKRQVWHVKLRDFSSEQQLAEVAQVRARIAEFSAAVRSGKVRGYTGKQIDTVVAIGIGGSYLGPEFVSEALKFETRGKETR